MAFSRTPYICASCSRSLGAIARSASTSASQLSRASFSTSSRNQDIPSSTTTSTDHTTYIPTPTSNISQTEPRWKQTPPAMRQPLRLRPQPRQPLWKVNTEQEPLDEMYDRLIGKILGPSINGRDALPEDVKWLAVTHKSFEHGAQGFNDKLAFLGKRIVDLQTTLALQRLPIHADPIEGATTHPALEGAENMTLQARHHVLDRIRLSDVATRYGVQSVMRWKPKKSDNLVGSGVQTVAAHTLYSIVGALALHRGGEVAAAVARQRILQPLGLR